MANSLSANKESVSLERKKPRKLKEVLTLRSRLASINQLNERSRIIDCMNDNPDFLSKEEFTDTTMKRNSIINTPMIIRRNDKQQEDDLLIPPRINTNSINKTTKEVSSNQKLISGYRLRKYSLVDSNLKEDRKSVV